MGNGNDASRALALANGVDVATIQRHEFGVSELQVVKETAATAVAAREKAAVEARYIMAMNRPRNIERARQQLLSACNNRDFAESSWYKIPNRGEGFTIRFAEEALRCFGNVYPESMTVYENDTIRMIRVNVTDLESNLSYSSELIIQKTVERKQLRKGQQSLGERVNSYGEKVYLVEATEDEITVKQNSALSKAIRTNGLRLIPSWISLEAKRAIFATLEGAVRKDLPAERRKVIDAFASLGITVSHLEQYFGKPIDQTTPPEIVDLQPTYNAIKEGVTTWDEIMDARRPEGSKEAQDRIKEEKLAAIRAEQAGQHPLSEGAAIVDAPDAVVAEQQTTKGQTRTFFGPGGSKH